MMAVSPSRISSPCKPFLVFFYKSLSDGIGIHGSCQCGFEANEVGSALDGVDVIGKGIDVFCVPFVPLQSNFSFNPIFFTRR